MITKLNKLEKGSYFRFLYTSDRYRNLRVLRASDSSVTITGEINEAGWKPLGNSYTVGPDIDVEKVDEHFYKNAIAENRSKIAIVRDSNYVPGKRGRKAKEIEELNIPKNKEFTIKDILKTNFGVNYNDVVKYLKVVLKDSCKVVRSASAGRGKPTNFYKIVN